MKIIYQYEWPIYGTYLTWELLDIFLKLTIIPFWMTKKRKLHWYVYCIFQ